MRNKILIFIFTLTSFILKAQFVPLVGHHSNTGIFFNPAITGGREVMTVTGTFRKNIQQELKAPHTEYLSIDMPLKNQNFAIGGFLYNDRVFYTRRSGLYVNGAYRLPVNWINKHKNAKLSLGLSAGAERVTNDWTNAIVTHYDDTELELSNNKTIVPNFSVGTYYYDSKLYVSLSVPYIMENNLSTGIMFSVSKLNYYFSSGYLIDVSKKIKLTPSFFYKRKGGISDQLELSLLALINNIVEIGASYRTPTTIIGLIGVQATPQLEISYTYDHSLGAVRLIRGTNHEISVRYEFKQVDNSIDPRFF